MKGIFLSKDSLLRPLDILLLSGALLAPIISIPGFNDAFSYPKWIAIHAITAIAAMLLAGRPFTRLQLDVPSSAVLISVVGLALAVEGFHSLVGPEGSMHAYVLHVLSLLCAPVLVASFMVALDKPTFFPVFASTLTAAAYIVTAKDWLYLHLLHQEANGTFGNSNMTAQFLGLAIIANIYVFSREPSRWRRCALGAAVCMTTVYALSLHCRSTDLGLVAAGIITMLCRREISPRKKIVVAGVGTIALLLSWGAMLDRSSLSGIALNDVLFFQIS